MITSTFLISVQFDEAEHRVSKRLPSCYTWPRWQEYGPWK
jgi:hypothetical protein